MLEGYLSAAEVAKRAGVSVSAIHRLAGRGTLASRVVGRQRFFTVKVVEAWLRDDVAQARRGMVKP